MPIVRQADRVSTPETRALEALQASPLSIGAETTSAAMFDLPDDRGILEHLGDANRSVLSVTSDPNNLVSVHMRRSGVISALLSDGAVHRMQGIEISRVPDPNFNPYDMLDQEFAAEHPYLMEHFESGRVLDLPNEEAFWHWARRSKADFEDRERMAQYGLFTNIAASIPALGVDSFVAGAAIRAFGLKGAATNLAEWTRRGNTLSRSAKTGLIAGSINLAQEELLRAVNPDRNVDEVEAGAMAFGMGLAFGASVPAIGAARRGAAGQLAARKVQRIQRETTEYFASENAADTGSLIAKSKQELQQILDSGEAPDSFTPIMSEGTRPLVNKIAEKHPDAQINRHPDQDMVDLHESMRRVESMADKALQAKGTNAFSTRYAQLLSTFAPAERLRRSGSSVARRVARVLFDDTTATRESVNSPLTHTVNTPAEGIRWNYDAWMIETRIKVEKALTDALKGRGKAIEYTYPDGERVTLRRKDMRAFGRATIDYMRRAEKASRLGLDKPDAPPAIRQAADALRSYTKRMGDEAVAVQLLKREIDGGKNWLPQRWKPWEVQRRAAEFTDRLYEAFKKNRERDFNTGKALTEADRAVDVDDVVSFPRDERLDGRGLNGDERRLIREWLDNDGTPLDGATEADLREAMGDAIADRYAEEVDIFLRKAANSTRETLSGLEASHGVTHAMGNDSFKRRLLQINQDEFSDFLVDDLDSLVGGYHRQVAGRVATRYAISRDADLLADMKQMGFDLKANDYDPSLLLQAVRRDFDDMMKIADGDPKRLDALEKEQGRVLKVLESKMNELQGVPQFQNNPAVGAGWSLLQRLSLRLPTMAFLGKVALSSLTDLAAHAFTKGLTPQHIKGTARSINLLKSVPDYGLEGLYVANSELLRSTRAFSQFDLDDLGEMRAFGPGGRAKAYEAVDRTTDAMTNTFFRMTGMNRWNRNQKRWMATLVLSEFIRGAKKMARAQRLMRDGMSELDAVQKVGLSPEDARLLNRLGINGTRAERLMKVMTEHGQALDLDSGTKRPWSNQADFERYDGYVSPEFNQWWKQDRDLFDTLTGAVNRHVQDLIVEPKMLSRPLINNTWLGRVFNQFQAFAFAWGNQHAHLAAQRPLYEQIGSVMLSVGIGGVIDALHNKLAGRRGFGDTAEQWAENPLGMVYGAINRSALTGWLVRPLGLLDQMPWGPGRLLGNEHLTGTYSRPIEPSGFLLGPFGSWADQTAIALMKSLYEGEIDDRRKRQLWNGLPYHNLWFFEGALRAAEAAGYETPQFVRPRTQD